MRWVYFFLIPGIIFSHFRWVKDQEVGIRMPILLKAPYDYHKQVFRIPFFERIGLSEARIRLKYRTIRQETYTLEIRFNYHSLFKVLISDTAGLLERKIPPTWLGRYNTLEINLSGAEGVGDAVEIDSLWLWVDIRKRREFLTLREFVSVSEGVVNIVFPEEKNVKTLSAVALFSQAMGFYFDKSVVRVSSNAPGIKRGGIVVIGTPEEQPYISELQSRIKDLTGLTIVRGYKDRLVWKSLKDESVGRKDGVIVFLFNDSGIPVIVASGSTPEGVWKAVTALVSEGFVIENYRVIHDEWSGFVQRKWVAPPEGDFSFRDLSWQGILLRGEEVDTVLKLNFLPGTKFAPDGHKMHFNFSVDRFVDAYTSTIKLYINDHLLGRFNVAQVKKGLDVELRHLKLRNYIRIKAKLRGITQKTVPYIYIENSSRFHIPRSWSVKLPDLEYLKHLAFPFGATYRGIKPAIIIDRMDIKKFELGVVFSRFIGLSGIVNSSLIFATSDSARDRKRNLVLIGHEYELLSPADSSLYIEEIVYPSRRVPRTFLILHCVNGDQARFLINLFSKPERLSLLAGERVTFSTTGFKVSTPLSQREIRPLGPTVFNPVYWIIAGAVLMLVLIIIFRILRASA